MPSPRIRVMLVDDHDLVRSSLTIALESYDDVEVIGEAGNGAEAVELCGTLHPDVILMDLKMPEMDGATATRMIRERYPKTQIVALTSTEYQALVTRAMEAGAAGYLLKNASMDDLYNTIRDVYWRNAGNE